jgi:hypothetical protein
VASLFVPNQVALDLFRDGRWVMENCSDESAKVELNGKRLTVEAPGRVHQWNWP